MKKENTAERAVALVKATIDAMRRAENAPDSPVNRFTSVEERRDFRRKAKRLRRGQLEPIFKNVHTGPQLADIYEQTALRDDIFDEARTDFLRAQRELEPIIAEDDPEVEKALDALVAQMEREAKEGGPASEAAHRLRCLQFLWSVGAKWQAQNRRQNGSRLMHIAPRLTGNPLIQARWEAAAAEILTTLPPGEPVWAFPAEDSGTGRGRVLMRIGVSPVSWIASFERGNKGPSTVQLMPGDTHFFVSAAGAGYIIEAKTRTLVEKIGDDVVSVGRDEPGMRFFVNHDDRRLEAFGPAGRLWKTEEIGSGGFRGLTLNGDEIIGEAQPSSGAGRFSIDLATGEVTWEGETRATIPFL